MNNAGIAINVDDNTEELSRKTANVNYFGTVYLSENMIPLIKENGKIITVGSQAGKVGRLSQELQDRVLDDSLTKEGLDKIAEEFFIAMRENTLKKLGFPNTMYGMSKVFINVYITKILSRKEDVLKKGIQVYCLCPGWVNTDLGCSTGGKPPLTVE